MTWYAKHYQDDSVLKAITESLEIEKTMSDLGPIFKGMVFRDEDGEIFTSGDMTGSRIPFCPDAIFHGDSGIWSSPDIIFPIPLTADILRDWFGMEEIKRNVFETGYVSHKSLHIHYSKNYWSTAKFFRGTYFSIQLKYVHQLQLFLAGLGLNHTVNLESNGNQ